MRAQLFVLLAAAHSMLAFGADVPSQGASSPLDIGRLIPADWVMTQAIQGDLNGDGRKDLAAVLLRGIAADGNPVEQAGSRGLLVLFADPAGGFRF